MALTNPFSVVPKIIIAVDGHSSCGKSTTAKQVATQLGYTYIDTGAMYRAVTLYFLQHKVLLSDFNSVYNALANISVSLEFNARSSRNETYLNGVNVEDEIRNLYVANSVSKVSALPEVRRVITKQQVDMGKKRGIVMDGRDIGTHVFPDAELKVFMTADPLVRAQRRQAELIGKGQVVNLDEIIENIKCRDHDDTTRVVSPLRQADDALLLDTSFTTIDEQIDWIVGKAYEKIGLADRSFNRYSVDVAV
jgi:cytidylate kinase